MMRKLMVASAVAGVAFPAFAQAADPGYLHMREARALAARLVRGMRPHRGVLGTCTRDGRQHVECSVTSTAGPVVCSYAAVVTKVYHNQRFAWRAKLRVDSCEYVR